MQNGNIATCKSATWNNALHKNSATREKLQHEKMSTTQKSATWRWCSMKKVQHEKSETCKKCNMKKCINYHSEIRKKCTRIVYYIAQMDNGPSVNRPLYTGLWKKMLNHIKTSSFLDLFERRLKLWNCKDCSCNIILYILIELLLDFFPKYNSFLFWVIWKATYLKSHFGMGVLR